MEYIWKENPVQLAGNLSLPGGFKLGAYGSEMCDVVTSTGKHSTTQHVESGGAAPSPYLSAIFRHQIAHWTVDCTDYREWEYK